MQAQFWFLIVIAAFQFGCISGESIEYVEGTFDEYYRLHWQPFVKENEKPHKESKFQRRQASPVTCTKDVLKNLPEECVERDRRGLKRRRRTSAQRF